MTLDNDRIKEKFDDIDGKIDLMMDYCRSLQVENKALLLKVSNLEADLNGKRAAEIDFSEHEASIQSKIDGLLEKLNSFSNSPSKIESLNP
ncbi:MAG: DUF904 domain-containing protein [Desulfobacula sp. RIFOXYB2_FULL_45_6]|nr:MAG: DUF904 domain-containing protein [Desulfobacula sp. RIFOXYB2_FULL_45_6]